MYDRLQKVTWLADANLPGKETFGVPNINRDGSMDYGTALAWVKAMNAYNRRAGWLGHNNWTLPTTPARDTTCSSHHVNYFGFHCLNSAMGSLYYVALGLREPNTAVPIPHNKVGPFENFQPYLYWSSSPNANHPKNVNGYSSFSFNTGYQGSNVAQNYLYVLPLIKGRLPGTPAATGTSLQANPGGKTVYDPVANVTWLADANLAASQKFGVDSINRDGSMQHQTAIQWVKAMNKAEGGAGYLGQTKWDLPPSASTDRNCSIKDSFGFGCTASPMGELFYTQLKVPAGESVVAAPDINVGPFHDIQPYLYWSCEGHLAQNGCSATTPAPGFAWSFSFGNGFEGTDVQANQLYVMVYYPGPSSLPAPKSPCTGTKCK